MSIMDNTSAVDLPDPAAIFACALSLWRDCMRQSRVSGINLSECYNGGDEFMRVLMRIGNKFEEWACRYVAFDALGEVWPYLLEERFGAGAIAMVGLEALGTFDGNDCLRVALRLGLPIKLTDDLRVPVDVVAGNPVANSEFRKFRIQTVRESSVGICEPFTSADDPFDEDFDAPFFSLYGVCDDGLLEHIADFDTFVKAVGLVRKLAPGISFPETPYLH